MLSRQDIQNELGLGLDINPFHARNIGPASYDVSLGDVIRPWKSVDSDDILDLCDFEPGYTFEVDLRDCDYWGPGKWLLEPGQGMLATTVETISVGTEMTAQVHSKSSLGRLGVTVTAGGAGFIDPGFSGEVTLEIVNMLGRPIMFTRRMLIAQVTFTRIETPNIVEVSYGSKGQYQNQIGPTEAKPIKMGAWV